MEIWFFATLHDTERISYQIEIPRESSLNVIVEGHRPDCYVCVEKSPIKTQCSKHEPLQHVEAMEKGQSAKAIDALSNTVLDKNNKNDIECTNDAKTAVIEKRISDATSEESGWFDSPKRRKKESTREKIAPELKKVRRNPKFTT